MTLLSNLYFYFFLFLFPQFFKTLKISSIFMHSLIIFFSPASFGWNFILYIINGYEKKVSELVFLRRYSFKLYMFLELYL